MSSFLGRMKEYQKISIDRFNGQNLGSTAFFLSHFHADHTIGLRSDTFLRRLQSQNNAVSVYCSEITRILMLADASCKHLEPYVKQLEVSVPALVTVSKVQGDNDEQQQQHVTVTLIPAGHCPGSVMFLFEGDEGTVLYTGDFRWEAGDAGRVKAFKNGDNMKEFKSLYVDTTFCTPNAFHIPSRKDCSLVTCEIVEEWLNKGSDHYVVIASATAYGHEHLLKEVAEQTGKKIHVGAYKFAIYSQIPDLRNVFTSDASETTIHACFNRKHHGSRSVLPCGFKPANGEDIHIRMIRPSTMWFTSTVGRGYIHVQTESLHRVCYSFHSSFAEVRDLVSCLHPERVSPNVLPMSDTRMDQIQRRLNNFLRFSSTDSKALLTCGPGHAPLGRLKRSKVRKQKRAVVELQSSEELCFGTPVKKRARYNSNTSLSPPTGHLAGAGDENASGNNYEEKSSIKNGEEHGNDDGDSSYDGSASGSELDLMKEEDNDDDNNKDMIRNGEGDSKCVGKKTELLKQSLDGLHPSLTYLSEDEDSDAPEEKNECAVSDATASDITFDQQNGNIDPSSDNIIINHACVKTVTENSVILSTVSDKNVDENGSALDADVAIDKSAKSPKPCNVDIVKNSSCEEHLSQNSNSRDLFAADDDSVPNQSTDLESKDNNIRTSPKSQESVHLHLSSSTDLDILATVAGVESTSVEPGRAHDCLNKSSSSENCVDSISDGVINCKTENDLSKEKSDTFTKDVAGDEITIQNNMDTLQEKNENTLPNDCPESLTGSDKVNDRLTEKAKHNMNSDVPSLLHNDNGDDASCIKETKPNQNDGVCDNSEGSCKEESSSFIPVSNDAGGDEVKDDISNDGNKSSESNETPLNLSKKKDDVIVESTIKQDRIGLLQDDSVSIRSSHSTNDEGVVVLSPDSGLAEAPSSHSTNISTNDAKTADLDDNIIWIGDADPDVSSHKAPHITIDSEESDSDHFYESGVGCYVDMESDSESDSTIPPQSDESDSDDDPCMIGSGSDSSSDVECLNPIVGHEYDTSSIASSSSSSEVEVVDISFEKDGGHSSSDQPGMAVIDLSQYSVDNLIASSSIVEQLDTYGAKSSNDLGGVVVDISRAIHSCDSGVMSDLSHFRDSSQEESSCTGQTKSGSEAMVIDLTSDADD